MTPLEELWYGNINPLEGFLNYNQQHKKLLSRVCRNRDELRATLTERQNEILDKYDANVNEMHSLSEQLAFRYGFSLGVRLMMESVSIDLTTNE